MRDSFTLQLLDKKNFRMNCYTSKFKIVHSVYILLQQHIFHQLLHKIKIVFYTFYFHFVYELVKIYVVTSTSSVSYRFCKTENVTGVILHFSRFRQQWPYLSNSTTKIRNKDTFYASCSFSNLAREAMYV
jgi:hypothetical protein